MIDLTLKTRIFAFFFIVLIIIPLCALVLYFSINEIRELFDYPNVVVFSLYSLASIIITPFVIIYLIVISCRPIIFGERVSEQSQIIFARFLIGAIVIGVISQIGFKIYYQGEVNNRGYIICHGIPNGTMPGMATKYAKSESLCNLER